MWDRQDGVSETRIDMNAAALLQQTAPYSFLRGLHLLLLPPMLSSFLHTCTHAHYQSPFISLPLSLVPLSTPFANRYAFDFFFVLKNALLLIWTSESKRIDYKPRKKSILWLQYTDENIFNYLIVTYIFSLKNSFYKYNILNIFF